MLGKIFYQFQWHLCKYENKVLDILRNKCDAPLRFAQTKIPYNLSFIFASFEDGTICFFDLMNATCAFNVDEYIDSHFTEPNYFKTDNAGSYMESRFDITIFGDKAELVFSLQDKLYLYSRDSVGKKQSVEVDGVFADELENRASIFSGSFRYLAPIVVGALRTGNMEALRNAAGFKDAEYNLTILNAIKKSANCGTSVLMGKLDNKYV